jgi:uncharacterized phage-associated protein
MPTARDVAASLLRKPRKFSNKELQKLLFFAEGHSLAWDGLSLFSEPFEGWVDGPVVRSVWNGRNGGNPNALSAGQEGTVDEVFALYKDLSEDELIDLTHRTKAWLDSRKGLATNQPGCREISRECMRKCFADQEQAFADLFEEFGLQTRIHRGRIQFVGTRQQAEEEIDRVCRLLHDRTISPDKHTLLIQVSGRCEYVEAATA